jgi:hypothetical protein
VAVKVFEIWHEVDEFLTSTPTPKQIPAFRPSAEAQERLRGRSLTLSQSAAHTLKPHGSFLREAHAST